MRGGGQLGLKLRTPCAHGGRRRGAGRKPSGGRSGVTHHGRDEVTRETPVHVTLRMRDHVWNLRSQRAFAVVKRALAGMLGRRDFRVVHFAVQGNHIHLIVEADGARALSEGVQGLSVRLAKGLNRLMGRRGTVLADRYHAHVLGSPLEVRRALAYVLRNHRSHMARLARRATCGAIDPFSSAASFDGWADAQGARVEPEVTSRARGWLLACGWRRHGLLSAQDMTARATSGRERGSGRLKTERDDRDDDG